MRQSSQNSRRLPLQAVMLFNLLPSLDLFSRRITSNELFAQMTKYLDVSQFDRHCHCFPTLFAGLERKRLKVSLHHNHLRHSSISHHNCRLSRRTSHSNALSYASCTRCRHPCHRPSSPRYYDECSKHLSAALRYVQRFEIFRAPRFVSWLTCQPCTTVQDHHMLFDVYCVQSLGGRKLRKVTQVPNRIPKAFT